MRSVPVSLFIFSLFRLATSIISLECDSNHNLTTKTEYVFAAHNPDKPSGCQVNLTMDDPYVVPVFNVTISGFQFMFMAIGVLYNSTNTTTGDLRYLTDPGVFIGRPMPFTMIFFDFNDANPDTVSYYVYITGKSVLPSRISNLTVYDDGSITFLDSEFLTPSRKAIQLFHSKNSTLQLRAIAYPNNGWTEDATNSLLIYGDGIFLCTGYDMLSKFSTQDYVRYATTFTVFSTNPQGKQGITFLSAINYTFPGTVQVSALSDADGPVSISAVDGPVVNHYIAPRNTNTIRYSYGITFFDAGLLTFYAGAITNPKDSLMLINITEDQAGLSVPLALKGRGRTLTLDRGNIIIDTQIAFQEVFNLVTAGQRGILMSSNYPYSSGEAEFDAIKLQGADNETFTYQVEIEAPGLQTGDFITIGSKDMDGNNHAESYSDSVQTTIKLTGVDLYIRYTIGAKSDGLLIRYQVREEEIVLPYGGKGCLTGVFTVILMTSYVL